MAEVGPSTRFRGIALTVLAAGGVFLPVAALAMGSLGLLPTQSSVGSVDPGMSTGQAAMAAYGASGILPQTTELSPSLLKSIVRGQGDDAAFAIPPGGLTIPPPALAAYQRAEKALALQQPDCDVSWTLLAGLGRVISDHGGGNLDRSGNSTRPILGPQLDGSPGLANIRDTDGGRLDTDSEWDRAAGPMQIIPTVWQRVGADSDADGFGSPHNIFDSALAAGRYLCEGDAELADVAEQAQAVFRYQRSDLFVRAVMAWAQAYGPRLVPNPDPGPALPPVEQIPPPADTPPPPGELPQGEPQAPVSVLPPPGPPPPGTTTPTSPDPTTTTEPSTEPSTTEPSATEPSPSESSSSSEPTSSETSSSQPEPSSSASNTSQPSTSGTEPTTPQSGVSSDPPVSDPPAPSRP